MQAGGCGRTPELFSRLGALAAAVAAQHEKTGSQYMLPAPSQTPCLVLPQALLLLGFWTCYLDLRLTTVS
jgi:hypothetical protein